MSVELFAELLNESNTPPTLSFGKYSFEFIVAGANILIKATDENDETKECLVKRTAGLLNLCVAISDFTRKEHPEDGVASMVSPVSIHRAVVDIIKHGANFEKDVEYAELIDSLKEHNCKKITLIEGRYVSTITYTNETVVVQVTKPHVYCNTAHFGVAGTVSKIVSYVVGEYQQLRGEQDVTEVQVTEALMSI